MCVSCVFKEWGTRGEMWEESSKCWEQHVQQQRRRDWGTVSHLSWIRRRCIRKRWDMEDLVDHTNLRSLLGGWAGARALELGLKGGVQIGSGREWHSRPKGWITKGREGRNRTGSCGNYTQSEWQEDRCLWRQPRW